MKEVYLGWLGQALVVILLSAIVSVTHADTFSLPKQTNPIPVATPIAEEIKP